MSTFLLDQRLAEDSFLLGELELCQIRLFNNSNYPWLLLIPQRNQITELFDLSYEDKNILFSEIDYLAEKLKQITGCDKINIAALGNMVPQLHVHIIARFKHDAAWPKPVWGLDSKQYVDPIHAVNYWREKLAD